MPNYSLVIGSKFRPFSYQEMLAPVLQQTQAHQQVEESYATLAAEADQWKNIAMSEPDSKAAETYMQYARDLESQADMLATKGLSLNSRRDAFKMAQRYQSEMLPIQQAYTTKMKDIEAQRAAGPDAVFSYDANNRSIDEYIANPTTTYETLDLNKAFTAAATDIGQIKGALTDLQKNGRLDAFHKYYAQVKGLTPKEAALTSKAMETGDWSGVDMSKPQNQFVYNAMNRVYSMYTQPWMNSDQDQKLKDYIARGAAYGIGTQDIKEYQDVAAVENYKARKAKEEQQKNLFHRRVLELTPGEGETSKESNKLLKDYKRYLEIQEQIKKDPTILLSTQKNMPIAPNSYFNTGTPTSSTQKPSEQEKRRYNQLVKEHEKYKLAEEYKKLEESLVAVAKKNNPNSTNYTSTSVQPIQVAAPFSPTGYRQSYQADISQDLSDAIKNIVQVKHGYAFTGLGEPAKAAIIGQLRNIISTSSDKRNEFIIKANGKGKKNSKLFPDDKETQDKLWKTADLAIEDGEVVLKLAGDTYTLMPGAFGTPDKEFIDEETGKVYKSRSDIQKLYREGKYDEFAEAINDWADNLYIWSNSLLPTQSTSTQDLTSIIQNW